MSHAGYTHTHTHTFESYKFDFHGLPRFKHIFLGGWSQGATLVKSVAIHPDCPSLGGLLLS